MKTQQQIIDTINRLASRKAGVNRREVRDSFQNDQRTEAMRVVGLMVSAAECRPWANLAAIARPAA